MKILLVEPDYYSRYPPLGLLKLGKMEERRFNDVKLVHGNKHLNYTPDKIYITSLFTYSWKPVHSSIQFYHNQYPNSKIYVGGIYATLLPLNIKKQYPFVNMHSGLVNEAENLMPAYHLLKQVQKWENWNKSILFTTRGCIRKCPFCVVPKIEGKMKEPKFSILPFVDVNHKEVVIWDNDFLASPFAKQVLEEIRDYGFKVDFNQGLDARLMTEEFAGLLSDIKSNSIHMAYDWAWEGAYVKKAIDLLSTAGYNKRNLIFYTLFNFYDEMHKKGDTPSDFLLRLKNLMEWGAASYPMRYIPLDALEKNKYVSPLWSEESLEMIAKARRVIGFGGSFVPYKAFIDKIFNSNNINDAMQLRSINYTKKILKPHAYLS